MVPAVLLAKTSKPINCKSHSFFGMAETKAKAQMSVQCPDCNAGAKVHTLIELVPYFGEILLTSLQCSSCNFKHTDVFATTVKEPMLYKTTVSKKADLSTKIIRNSSSTIEIPELGVKIEPGVMAEGYVTNIEGLLSRVEEVVGLLSRSDHQAQSKAAKARLAKLQKAKDAKMKFTVILLDPFGNSAIVGENVQKKKLSANELKKLKTSMQVFEAH